MRRHPILALVGLFINDIDNDPKWQLKIHTWGFWFWIISFPAVTYMFFCQPNLWATWGLYITLMFSIYANASTDMGGIASSNAVINTNQQETKK